MKKLLTFSYILRNSLFSLKYYHEIIKARFKFSLKFFIAFNLCIGLLTALSICLGLVPASFQFLSRFQSRAFTLYPNDLVISIKNGQISTNVAEPLRIPFPFELFMQNTPSISDQKQIYLATIDTKATVADFDKFQSLMLITKDKIIIKNQNDFHEENLSNIGNVNIDKKFVDEKLNQLMPFLKFLPWILSIIIIFITLIFLPLTRFISLFIYTLILILPSKLIGTNLGFKKIFQIGLHSSALPILIQISLLTFGFYPEIPFFGSLVFILFNLVILAEIKKTVKN